MGEKIKVLSQIKVNLSVLDIELNKETVSDGPRYIHIQNEFVRYNLTEIEFIQLATAMNKAKKYLLHIKGMGA